MGGIDPRNERNLHTDQQADGDAERINHHAHIIEKRR